MKYQRKADVVARSVAGEDLLIPVHGCTNSVYTLNPTACRLWDALEKPHDENELTDLLVQRYSVARDIARADVQVFLQDLIRMKLVESCKH